MSEFRITNANFYLKKKAHKRTAAAADLLLSHWTQLSLFESLDYHVFLESHGNRHHVWQIVDLGLPKERRKHLSAVDDGGDILSGEKRDPSLVVGRLFTISRGPQSDELMNEIINALIRARWPYEIVGDCQREGLVTRDRWQAALDAFDAEHARHQDEARSRVADNPCALVTAAEQLALHPRPTGEHPDQWRASCPGTNHHLYILAPEDRWFCGWCKRKGGPAELEAFCLERRLKAL